MVDVENWQIDRFIEYARNPRKNDHAVERVAAAIREFGFKVPIRKPYPKRGLIEEQQKPSADGGASPTSTLQTRGDA